MSDKTDSNEHNLKGTVWEDAGPDPWCDPAYRRKAQMSGWMKGIGVLVLWFGFWGILSII